MAGSYGDPSLPEFLTWNRGAPLRCNLRLPAIEPGPLRVADASEAEDHHCPGGGLWHGYDTDVVEQVADIVVTVRV